MKRILITGYTGMLGCSIADRLSKNPNYTIYGIARKRDSKLKSIFQIEGDLADTSFYDSLQFVAPDIIIHTSALVDLNLCETEKTFASRVNSASGKHLATLFPNAHFIYISTDSVFDGVDGNYKEEMQTNPLNHYAFTKREGERVIQKISKRALILRTNIFGHKSNGKSLFDWAYQELKHNKPIKGFEDVYFNPLYTGQVAQIIEQVLTQHPHLTGIYHLGCHETLNKYEFLKLISKIFQLNEELIAPSSIKNFPSKVKRPLNTTLNTQKLAAVMKRTFSIEEGMLSLKNHLKAA